MIDAPKQDDGTPAKAGNPGETGRRIENPVLAGLTALLVVFALGGVLWRAAGSPAPWRAQTDRPIAATAATLASATVLPRLPPPETFAPVFAPCAHCHEIGPGARTTTGPPLTGIIGRKAAAYPGYPYSAALRGAGFVWDRATLARFIADPQAVAPGSRMIFAGLPQDEIDALVSYIANAGANDDAAKTLPPLALAIGGPFTLVDTHGAVVTQRDLLGKPSAMFFGYTGCPDICPTTLLDLTEWMKAMGADADKLNVIFVTIDPARDTPAKLADYLSSFDPRIRALSGTDAQIAAIAKAYHIYYQRVPDGHGGYSMYHTASVFLMDATGGFAGTLSFEEDPKTSLAKLERLVKAPS
jgi:protein SCO1/2